MRAFFIALCLLIAAPAVAACMARELQARQHGRVIERAAVGQGLLT